MYPPSTARTRPDAIAYVMAGSGERITYAELDRRSNRLARFWQSRGVGPGDSVVLVMENSLAWPVAVAAGMRSGLYVTPVNWHLKPTELAALIQEDRPAAIVTSTALADRVVAAVDDSVDGSGRDQTVIVCADGPADGCVALSDALAGQLSEPLERELLGARVLYSGGTTGRPKRFAQPLLGVHPADAPRRHPGLVDELGVGADSVLLSPAPNYHAAPFTFQLITLAAGGTVVCMERFDAAGAMRAITEYGVTHSQWVPTMLIRLSNLPDRETIALSPRHRVAFTSGAPCPPHVKEAIFEWWGPVLHEYYGASEGYGHTYISPSEARSHPGSVGRPLGAARVHITDSEGDDVGPGVEGTVCFEAAGGPADASRPALKQMGDIGYLDADGFLYLVGRRGFMIISGGVNIYPEEIESALLAHPAVADVAVVGVPDTEFGESVKAVVEVRAGASVSEDDLIAHAREHLAHFKAPRSVEFTTDLPRLPTGKLDKRRLVDRFATPGADAGRPSGSSATQGDPTMPTDPFQQGERV
ncbi:AMP-binding protein [Gordonia terrae]|uniref:Fatty-acid--CoA ligase n=2 Tax=Gordonia terrae TaxID=2055 RepID=A0AAD0KAC2_9ACTN|nr:AMP-binding protein [Gordonia terrae]VTR07988.1 acyl-CoA synthetase (AMP-forming)/AMP-acid ligase II [Clostridioides difficile]ANY25133.1 fatty-acid--CoA ligase [Gordonia terrae]AWO85880.1 fatty-acid--CoA ligase [Gordonia terrae]VTS61831.1 Long-chain-fatty-acid--CoA ligase [Gordonia terrae]GAB45459.1 putative fatty-acid--CoA ligase [Gordonia terrae NBRC 100016]